MVYSAAFHTQSSRARLNSSDITESMVYNPCGIFIRTKRNLIATEKVQPLQEISALRLELEALDPHTYECWQCNFYKIIHRGNTTTLGNICKNY